MIQIPEDQWASIKQELEELRAWNETAIQSNIAVDAYLRKLYPDLPEHYGMPIDGIRKTVRALLEGIASDLAADDEFSDGYAIFQQKFDRISTL